MERLHERPQFTAELEGSLAGGEATLTARPPTVQESQPQSLLVPAGTLDKQFHGCSNELQRLAQQALECSEISVFARTILHPIEGQLKDIRLRLDIWMSDIEIEKGTLNESDAFKQSRLFSVITKALQRINSQLEAVSKDLEIIKFETELITRTEQRNVSGVKQADARVSDALSAITLVLRNLADLATSIQIFRAIQTNEGPYSELYTQVSTIKAQPEEKLASIPAEASTGTGRDDEDQCPNCRRWFGLDDLSTHVVECPKAEVQVVPSTQSEPVNPSTPSANPVGTFAGPTPSRTPRFRRISPIRIPDIPDIPDISDISDISDIPDIPYPDTRISPISIPDISDIPDPDTRISPIRMTDIPDTRISIPHMSTRRSRSSSDSLRVAMLTSEPASRATFVDLSPGSISADMDERVRLRTTQNFVLRLQSPNLSIAVDVPTIDTVWNAILTSKVHIDAPQWINIWDLCAQHVAIIALAKFYHFSRLLLESLLDSKRRPFRPYKGATTRTKLPSKYTLGNLRSVRKDVELGEDEDQPDSSSYGSRWHVQENETDSLHSHSLIVDSRYTCIAYNRTYGDVTELLASQESTERLKSREDLNRVRSWLILCHDGTVISIHHVMYHAREESCPVVKNRPLQLWRMHTLEVLDEVLRLPASKESGLSESIRRAKQDASTLFYHLYDDRRGVFSDLAPIIRQYNWTLKYFRESGDGSQYSLQQISWLEDLGLGLSELKRSFEVSAEFIHQLLHPPPEYVIDEDPLTGDGTTFARGTTLSVPTFMLFLRLRRRINDQCVAKVQRLIDEKEALSRILSHVTPYKQAQAIQRLGLAHSIYQRVIIALLCLILMSTYFSNSIDNLRGVYTATTYWVTFTVIVVINAIFLLAYSLGQIPRGRDGFLKRYLDHYFPFLPVQWTQKV